MLHRLEIRHVVGAPGNHEFRAEHVKSPVGLPVDIVP